MKKVDILKKAIQTCYKIHPVYVITVFFVDFIFALIPLLLTYLIANITEAFLADEMQLFFILVLWMLILIFLKSCYTILYERYILMALLIPKFEYALKKQLQEKCQNCSAECYEDPLLNQRIQQAQNSSMNIFRLVQCFSSLLSILLTMLLLVFYTLNKSLLLLGVTVFLLLPEFIFSLQRLGEKTHWQLEKAKVDYKIRSYKEVVERGNGLKEISIYRLFSYMKKQWHSLTNHMSIVLNELTKHTLFIIKVKQFFRFFSHAVILTIGILLCYIEFFDVVDFMGVYFSFTMIFEHFEHLFSMIASQLQFVQLSEVYFNFMDQEDETLLQYKKSNQFLELSHVYFRYPHQEEDALKDISLTLHKGEKLGIVGLNGGGKSTLAKILAGLYYPSKGDMNLNQSIQVSMMFQEQGKYYVNVQEFIKMGNSKIEVKESGLLEEFGLKLSYTDFLGKELGGIECSGGQLQRLSLIRSIVKKADLFIFDEPTSAIDPLFEKEILSAIFNHIDGKTMVLISHRLSAIPKMDKIIMMDGGRIRSMGNFDELILNDEVFRKMWGKISEQYG